MKKVELLSPCGDFGCLKIALQYGADAVYLGRRNFSMRTAPKNFEKDELAEGIKLAHSLNKKVYLTCNTYPHSDELKFLPDFLKEADEIGIDALIVADLGVLEIAKKTVPDMAIHISTQAGIINYKTARMYYNLGASRIVTARELSLDEIAEIRAKTNKNLEIECFVHGSMCMSFSGRCLMSDFMIGRDANRGECAQPCRWEFEITDLSRPSIRYPVETDRGGTYFMNSCDICMIEHIPELVEAGIDSFKIEGRAKSSYYVAIVTNAYRQAVDGYYKNPCNSYIPDRWILDEMDKVSHREYSTGFYFGHPNHSTNIDYSGGYIKNYAIVAYVVQCDGEIITLSQRNKFLPNDELEVLEPNEKPQHFTPSALFDEEMNEIASANHAMMTVKIKSGKIFAEGSIIRKKL